jgi:Domain of unknown function (DUF4157)
VRTRPHATASHGTASHADPVRPFFSPQGAGASSFFTASPFAIAKQAEPDVVEGDAIAPAPIIQTKLAMGAPGDRFEEEADAMADRVVQRMPVGAMRPLATPSVQTKCADCLEEERLQRQADGDAPDEFLQAKADGSMEVPGSVEHALAGGTGGGGTMHPALRDEMESAFDADFSGVRIHTGPSAEHLNRDLRAHAFTHGKDIYFNAGQYRPQTTEGRHLLAHELTHVAQQTRGKTQVQRQPTKQPSAESAYTFKVEFDRGVKPTKNEFTLIMYSQIFGVNREVARDLFARHPGSWASALDITDAEVAAGSKKISFGPTDFYDAIVAELRPGGVGTGGTGKGGTGSGSSAKTAADRARQLGTLPKTEQQKINEEANREFWDRTKYKPGEQLDPGKSAADKEQAELWTKMRDELLRIREMLGELPPAVRDTLGDPAQYTPAQYDQLLRIGKKIAGLSAEDLLLYRIVASSTTTDLVAVETGLDQFIQFKEKYRKALEANSQPAATTGAPADIPLDQQLAKSWEGFDKQRFGAMGEPEKEATARSIASQRARTQLKYMATHPGQTAVGMAKGLNPAEVYKGIDKDIKEFKGSESNWGKWASGTGIGAKVSGWVAGVAAVAWVVMWFIPGVNLVNLMATAMAVALYAGIAAVLLSGTSAELHIQAAASAKTEGEFETQTNAAADEITSFVMGAALLVAAFVLKLLGRVKFVQRYMNIGKILNDAKVKAWAAVGVDALKAVRNEAAAAIRTELAALDAELQPAQAEHAALRQQIEALTPKDLMKKIATDPAFAQQLGLDPQQAKAFGPAAEGPLAEHGAPKVKAKILDAMDDAAAQAKARVDRFKADAQKVLDDLTAADDKTKFDAAVDRAQKTMAPEEQARVSQEAGKEYQDKKLQAALKELDEQTAKAKADADTAKVETPAERAARLKAALAAKKAADLAKEAARLEAEHKVNVADAEKQGKLPPSGAADRTWLDADPSGRRKELAYDPPQDKFRVREAQAALAAEANGKPTPLKGPVKRSVAPGKKETGFDYVDADGADWDHVQVRDPATAKATIEAKAHPLRPGAAGENALVDLMDLSPADAKAVMDAWNAAAHPAGTGKVVFVLR